MAPSRRHAAARSRLVAAGLSASTVAGMVATMGVSAAAAKPAVPTATLGDPAPTTTAAPIVPGAAPPRQQIVVVRRRYIHVPAGAAVPVTSPPTSPGTAAPRSRRAAPAAAPTARSSGS